MVPPNTEHVSITLNGVTQDATIQNDGTFSSAFDTRLLDVANSTYTINWHYDGDATFTPANTTTSLTVTKAHLTVKAYDQSKTYDGVVFPLGSFSTTITGFVNSETVAAVSGTAAFSANATRRSTPGATPSRPASGP